MASQNTTIRDAAQAAGARLGIREVLRDIYAQLSSEDVAVFSKAANSLLGVPPADEADRAAREQSVLACMGRPSGDYVLRVLATCGADKSVKVLEPILDDLDVRRAVYAAWVLAQLPDKTVATKGIRRVAIFGLFHHYSCQWGAVESAIRFTVPGLSFRQVNLMPGLVTKGYAADEGPVRIPNDLLGPFTWDDREQQYAVRCYHFTETVGDIHVYSRLFARVWTGQQNKGGMDTTQLPLLMEIVANDSQLDRLMVKGQAVAHFCRRQQAARVIAAITKERATYCGLAGETLDSDAFPQPYQDQNQLLARFFVDRLQKAQLPDNPRTDQDHSKARICRTMAERIGWRFGTQALDAIREEASRREIDVKELVPDNASIFEVLLE